MDIFTNLQPLHWFVFALVLLGIETLGAGGFVIGTALAAFSLWLLGLAGIELDWQMQLVIFSVLAIIYTVGYWKYFRNFNQKTDQPNINNRAAQLIGRQVTLSEDIGVGEAKLSIGDTLWRVRCAEPLSAGARIEVYDNEDMTLLVRPVN